LEKATIFYFCKKTYTMSVYRFKVYFEDDESVVREIEIKSTQNFEDFHRVIQKAINFDDAHPASFYISNDTWRKGKEIKLQRNKNALQKALWMHENKIASYIEDPHQKMIYEFDPDNGNWVLLVELAKILPDSPIDYPRINKSMGTAPVQYKITTPVEVVEDEEDGHPAEDDPEDTYTHNVIEHSEVHDEEEVEGHLTTKTKMTETGDGEEEVVGEEEGEEGFEEEGGLEEEEL
jgi:hypothetical protein